MEKILILCFEWKIWESFSKLVSSKSNWNILKKKSDILKVITPFIDNSLSIWIYLLSVQVRLVFFCLGVAHQCYHGFMKAVQEGNIQWESRTYPYPGTPITQRFSHSKCLPWEQTTSCLPGGTRFPETFYGDICFAWVFNDENVKWELTLIL